MQLAPGTWRLAGPILGAGAVGLLVSPLLGLGLTVLAVFVIWFHRDPERTDPPEGVLAPADGTVSVIRTETDDERAGTDEQGTERVRVGVFMNVTDVHVNRAPVSGTIGAVEHVKGGHWPAFSKDADRNERLHVDIGDTRVTLIAGTVARRIHAHVSPGERIERGERIGHVSFGSRADVLLPERFDPANLAVEPGEAVRAGESVIAVEPES
ncbi:MAG: protein sorting system archaetidylserine decarboxylase [Halodesulfurarchaeum sp.]|nr:protein sorting system archaetidylserine decarboxylase [Halodesulfurarchaeum sp.]